MSKLNKILAGLLILQLILIVIVFWENDGPPTETTQLVAGLAKDQVDRLLIFDEEGEELSIRLQEGAWKVDIGEGIWYPADSDKVMSMIEKIAGLKSSRLVTMTRGSHDRLKVGDKLFSRKIFLGSGEGDQVVVYLGTAPNYKSIHFRNQGDNNVYLVKNLSAWEVQAEPASWWQTSYVEFDPEKLVEIHLQNENGNLLLKRNDPQSEWVLVGDDKKIDKEKLNNFIEDVSHLSVTKISQPSEIEPSEDPLAVLSLKGVAREIELKIWDRKDDNSDHPVKSSGDSFFALAGRYAVDDLLNTSVNDLAE